MEVLSRSAVASWVPHPHSADIPIVYPISVFAPRRRRRRVSWSFARVAACVFWDLIELPMPSLGARFVSIFLSTDE